MLVVLPTHPADRALAVNLCERIAFLGGAHNHEFLIVSPLGTSMDGIENVLRGAFGQVFTHQYQPTLKGWPYGANEVASVAMMHIWSNPALRYHYLMLEPDCVPMHKNWIDMLDAEYRRSIMPGISILGVKINTVEIGTNRVVGMHTVGVAVYPKDFPRICPLVASIGPASLQYRMQNAMPPPWDAYFGPYTAKQTAHTNLIQHLMRQRQQDAQGNVRWDCPSLENALSQVSPEAILVHGSKHPEFIHRITGRNPNDRKIESNDFTKEQPSASKIESIGGEAQPALQNVGDDSRKEGGEESSHGTGEVNAGTPPQRLTGKEKIRLRQQAKKEEIRAQFGIEAKLDTPEYLRSFFFHFDMQWGKLRKYATKLRINTQGMTKAAIVNECVRIEKKQRKEKWTKDLPVETTVPPAAPLLPVEEAPLAGGFAVSTTAGTGGGLASMLGGRGTITPINDGPPVLNNPISVDQSNDDEMKKKMRQLLIDRGLPVG